MSKEVTIDSILAGVVTYEPDIERLEQNISELSKQVKYVMIVDNGSSNKDEIQKLIKKFKHIDIECLFNDRNLGIAQALGTIMDYASKKGFEWVLTLDQDSVIKKDLINEYMSVAGKKENQDVAMFTCLIKDRNFVDRKYEYQKEWTKSVPYCITSAAFTNVEDYKMTSGYDERFFIDCVDFDICYLLREAGYRILRINYTGLIHEVGHGENRRFLWKKIVVYHQKPSRIYFLARNTVWMWKKHGSNYGLIVMLKKLVALYLRIFFYEDHKKDKFLNFWKGISDSYKKF